MKRVRRMVAAMAAAVVLAGLTVVPAQAASLDAVDVTGRLSTQGVLTITQTFTLPSGSDLGTLTEQLPAYMDRAGQRYTYTVSDITATVDDVMVPAWQTRTATATEVSVDVTGATTLVLTYTVTGATTTAVDGKVDFTWEAVGALNTDVTTVTGAVDLPPGPVNYACQTGAPGALISCSTYGGGTHGSTTLTFTQAPLRAGQIVSLQAVYPAGAVTTTEQVKPVWTLGRALTPGGTQIGSMLLILLAGGLILFAVWRRIRSAGYKGAPVAVAGFSGDAETGLTFTATPEGRPGMVGTLIDSSVDPADILATILDLAARGHLLITEVETSRYATADWTFTRLATTDPLRGYESALLDVLCAGEARVSKLSQAVHPAIGQVQDALYQEVMAAGWYSRLPSKRSPLVGWGWAGLALAVVVTGLLMAFTTYGLVGLALVGLAIVALDLAYHVRPVTAKGAAVYAGLTELSQELHEKAGSQLEEDGRYEEISRILPYAVVLGSWEHWLTAMAEADKDPDPDPEALAWYHAPADWQLSDFPHSLDAFITVVTGRLFARA